MRDVTFCRIRNTMEVNRALVSENLLPQIKSNPICEVLEDPLPFAYTLEVSSPGLDRPLRSEHDYRRFEGRLAKIVVSEPVDNQRAFEGRLRGVEAGAVLLEGPNGRLHRLPVPLITRGRLEVEF